MFNSVYVACIADHALGEQKPSRQLKIVPGRSHRYGDRFDAPEIGRAILQSNFEWLFTSELVHRGLTFQAHKPLNRHGDLRRVRYLCCHRNFSKESSSWHFSTLARTTAHHLSGACSFVRDECSPEPRMAGPTTTAVHLRSWNGHGGDLGFGSPSALPFTNQAVMDRI